VVAGFSRPFCLYVEADLQVAGSDVHGQADLKVRLYEGRAG